MSEDQSQKSIFRIGVRECEIRLKQSLIDAVSVEVQDVHESMTPLELIEIGAVYINDQRSLNPQQLVGIGDKLRIHTSPRRFARPRDLRSCIAFETSDSLVVEKPKGLPTEPTVDNVSENLISFLEDSLGQRFFLVHRLEPESAGLVIIAKSLTACERLKSAFAEGRVQRTYTVLTAQAVPRGVLIDSPELSINVLSCESNQSKTHVLSVGAVQWRVSGLGVESFERVVIELTRGRPNEMREALARVGHPILGDRKQGSSLELVCETPGYSDIAMLLTAMRVD